MSYPQPGILAPLPPLARYLTFRTRHNADLPLALAALQPLADGRDLSGYEDGTENPEGDDAAAAQR